MKLILKSLAVMAVLVLSVVVVSAHSAQVSAAQPTDAKAKLNVTEQQVLGKERAGLDALKIGDLGLFGKLTAEDALMIDASGQASKAQVLSNVAGFKLTDYSMEDIKFVKISSNTELISYKITEKGVSHDHEFAAKAYVSSIWTKRGDSWFCLFSQETGTK